MRKIKEGPVFLASNIFTRFVDKDIGHGLVIPERSFAARHVSDTTDPIDDAKIVPVAALVVSHRLSISLAVWVFGAAGRLTCFGLKPT